MADRSEDEKDLKPDIDEVLESDEELENVREKQEEMSEKDEIVSSLEMDEEIEKLREDYRESGLGELEIQEIEGLGSYDPLKYGELVESGEHEGWDVVEEYWLDQPYSFAEILENVDSGEHKYHLTEPNLTDTERKMMKSIWEELRDRLPYEDIRKEKRRILRENYMDIVEDHGMNDSKRIHKILYYLVRDNLGYGKITPLMEDDNIEDISCDGIDIPIYIYHNEYYNLRTNVSFSEDMIDTFVTRIAEKCGEHISYAEPVVESRLPDGSRLQATLGSEVTTKGSSFTIRKFTGGAFTPVDLIKYNTFNSEMLANLWMAIESGKSLMVVGGTASGKTSTLNALGFFIPPDSKIVTIEDTRELSLYQENWLPNLTRETSSGGENLDMHELVRKAMRQRPECLIVGEVRGKEALAMFQAISTGHTAFSTMHAGSIQDCVNRLVGEPINLPRPMLAELDIISLQLLTNLGRKRVRRNRQIVELLGLEPESNSIKMVTTYKWSLGTDSFDKKEESQILREIREDRGMSIIEMDKEIQNRKKILQYMVDEGIESYKEIASYIRQYYFEPEKVLDKISD